MTAEMNDIDRTVTTGPSLVRACAGAYMRGRADARALTFSYATTAITRKKTFRERQISICPNRRPRKTTSTPGLARTYAHATGDSVNDNTPFSSLLA